MACDLGGPLEPFVRGYHPKIQPFKWMEVPGGLVGLKHPILSLLFKTEN